MSRTSEEVRPKWIQRPASPADADEFVHEGGHVVVGDTLALFDGLDGEGGRAEGRELVLVGPSLPSRKGELSAAPTSTRRHASIRAWSVHSAAELGPRVTGDHA